MSALETGLVLDRVPIFPLPEAVLFPATLLPLHVFEPRYLDLVDAVLASDEQYLGIVQLTGDWRHEYQGRPPIRSLFGLGRVVNHETTDGGRRNILVHGLARATILEELPPDERFRTVRCQVVAGTARTGEIALKMATVRQLAASWLAAVPGLDMKQAESLFDPEAPPAQVMDAIASALPLGGEVRQALLEAQDLESRADQLVSALVELPPARGDEPDN